MTSSADTEPRISGRDQSTQIKAFVRRFYLPLALALMLGASAFFNPEALGSLALPPGIDAEIKYWIISLKIPASVLPQDTATLRILFGLASIALALYAVCLDFSKFFPSLLKLDVFYDLGGITAAVNELSQKERLSLEVHPDWNTKVAEYDLDVIAGLRDIWQKNHHPDAWPSSGHPRPYFTGSGYTTFNVSRIGLLSYRVGEATGRLTYSVQTPRDGWTFFPGAAKLIPTIHNYIRPRLLDILMWRSVLIRPEFAQIFGVGAVHDGIGPPDHDHTLVAVTRVTLFPLPAFGDTLYLWRGKDGLHIPIARSVNT